MHLNSLVHSPLILTGTSSALQGMVAVVDPSTSWAARWLHHRKHVAGCYALTVEADLPQHIMEILDSQGIVLRQDD